MAETSREVSRTDAVSIAIHNKITELQYLLDSIPQEEIDKVEKGKKELLPELERLSTKEIYSLLEDTNTRLAQACISNSAEVSDLMEQVNILSDYLFDVEMTSSLVPDTVYETSSSTSLTFASEDPIATTSDLSCITVTPVKTKEVFVSSSKNMESPTSSLMQEKDLLCEILQIDKIQLETLNLDKIKAEIVGIREEIRVKEANRTMNKTKKAEVISSLQAKLTNYLRLEDISVQTDKL